MLSTSRTHTDNDILYAKVYNFFKERTNKVLQQQFALESRSGDVGDFREVEFYQMCLVYLMLIVRKTPFNYEQLRNCLKCKDVNVDDLLALIGWEKSLGDITEGITPRLPYAVPIYGQEDISLMLTKLDNNFKYIKCDCDG
jgi:hypothetical protein